MVDKRVWVVQKNRTICLLLKTTVQKWKTENKKKSVAAQWKKLT